MWNRTQCYTNYINTGLNTDCVYMLEHNHVMNVSNEDWINVNRLIRSASPKGLSQDRISEADRIAGLEPFLVGYLLACVLDRIGLPGGRVEINLLTPLTEIKGIHYSTKSNNYKAILFLTKSRH